MRKGVRNFLIICGIVFGIGVIATITGVAMGGLTNVILEGPWYHIKAAEQQVEVKTITEKKFTSVDLDASISDVEFIASDEYKVSVSYSENSNSPEVKINNNVLRIKETTEEKSGLGFFFEDVSVIKIYYPKDKVLDSVKMYMSVGDLELENIKSKSFNLAMDAGDLDIKNITSKNFRGQVSLGDAEISGKLLGKTNVEVSKGDMELNILGNIDSYDYNFDSSIGEFELNGQETKNKTKNTGAKNIIKGYCDLGDISINFI